MGMITAGTASGPTPSEFLAEHLGAESARMPVVGTTWAPFDHVNVQAAVDVWLAEAGITPRLVGVSGSRHRMFGLADLCQPGADMGMAIGGVEMSDVPSGPGDQVRSCVQCGLYLIDGPAPMAMLLRGGEVRGPQQETALEIVSADRAAARAVLADIRRLAIEHSVYRGQVLTFGGEMFGKPGRLVTFHERPTMTRDQLILPPGMLEGIEGQILAVARHREALLAHGQHLKRGVLLYGEPGTGKTHTVRYLLSSMPEATVVLLTGTALHMIGAACELARTLEPSLVVIEDVDLIAMDRERGPHTQPLLFQLLNEMDGLAEDADVTFVLTTNRVEVLEPALVARPGRIDHAVEVPIPDAEGRRRLFELYRGGLELDLAGTDDLIARLAGVTASFIKELIRRAALHSAEQSAGGTGGGALSVTKDHLEQAFEILAGDQHRVTRKLLGVTEAAS